MNRPRGNMRSRSLVQKERKASKRIGKDYFQCIGKNSFSTKTSNQFVGRIFQYVTRKGERKNYIILSYLPLKGMYRVERWGVYRTKAKEIDLKELSNIRWLDGDENVNESNTNENGNVEQTVVRQRFNKSNLQPNVQQTEIKQEPVEEPVEARDEILSPRPTARKRKASDAVTPDSASATPDRKSTRKRARRPVTTIYDEMAEEEQERRRSIEERRKNKPRSPPSPSDSSEKSPNKPKTPSPSDSSKTSRKNPKRDTPVSKYMGVSTCSQRKSHWRARCARKSFVESFGDTHIGSYQCEVQAAKAYDEAIRQHCLEEAITTLNFPTEAEKKLIKEANDRYQEETDRMKARCADGPASVYMGVSRYSRRGMIWRARCNRRDFVESFGDDYIGSYATEEEAARGYDDAMREHCGVEALGFLNFPTDAERKRMENSENYRPTSKKGWAGSLYRGVALYKDGVRWLARCHRREFVENFGKARIGVFETEIEAARAHDEHVRKHTKLEFIYQLNFPTEEDRQLLKEGREFKIKTEPK